MGPLGSWTSLVAEAKCARFPIFRFPIFPIDISDSDSPDSDAQNPIHRLPVLSSIFFSYFLFPICLTKPIPMKKITDEKTLRLAVGGSVGADSERVGCFT